LGVNDSGQVAGSSNLTFNGAVVAFRYDGTPGSGGIMRNLGSFGGPSTGRAVNSSGQVAGYSYTEESQTLRAFRFDGTPGSGGIMRDLETLGGSGSDAWAVNDSGQVAGNADTATASHAFRYDGTPGSGGIMRDLGTLGGTFSSARDINNAAQIVGFSNLTGDLAQHAFLYTGTPGAGGSMLDLDAWLDANNPAEGSKWTLTEANSISGTGWIVGTGAYDDGPAGLADGTRAFLLDASAIVPEPTSLTLLALSGMGLLRRRR
jgi:probable HAF family extracellular repeat protein